MSVPSGDEEQGFKVTDRRAAADEDTAEAQPAAAAAETSDALDEEQDADYSNIPAPPADFNTLVLSLSTSALMYLGMLEAPEGEPSAKNLPLARHTIDLLAMLEKKTKGNLSGEEEMLLGQVLYDLRMHFVTASKS